MRAKRAIKKVKAEKLDSRSLTVTPIGYVKADKIVKFDARHQPKDGIDEPSIIELVPGHNFGLALNSLDGFDRIWLIWWFDRNDTWRPLVLPPRGPAVRRGVFATRSPHRPNPIGMTAVRLIEVLKDRIVIGNSDLLDGTPILDIKPYLSTVDAFPDSGLGWLEEVERAEQAADQSPFIVKTSQLAKEHLDWLKNEWQIDILTRAIELLSRDPSPHRTRRITKVANSEFRLSCGAWRIFFAIPKDKEVLLLRVAPGYPKAALTDLSLETVPHREAQLGFFEKWSG